MRPVLLIDFGSTYTKLTAVDVDVPRLLGCAATYTTVATDINEGLQKGLRLLEQQCGPLAYTERYACSSAAGGLRMIASGLVPELTAAAANSASLGAGAKVLRLYSFELTEDDCAEIAAARPDILLLVGGTDGGNSDCILHNAQALAKLGGDFPIILAGNRSAARQCQRILQQDSPQREVYICPNVMPRFGQLNIAPVQQQIRELFLKRIIRAKGLSQASSLIDGVIMPTPAAVLQAIRLLAQGCTTPQGELTGIGDLLAVDVGGATTDVYSAASGMPQQAAVVYKGLPEPYVKRTVEGDIGMRYSIHGIVQAVGLSQLAQRSGLAEAQVAALVAQLAAHTEQLPGTDAQLLALDTALAEAAIEVAVNRHVGTIEEAYTLAGQIFVQNGKDLRPVRQLLLTGGSVIHSAHSARLGQAALYKQAQPQLLKPQQARLWVDRKYIVAAMGLLAEHYPAAALELMKGEIEHDGYLQ